MIQFIHEDIYNKKEKESHVNNLLEMTLIYSKNTHLTYIQMIITQNNF